MPLLFFTAMSRPVKTDLVTRAEAEGVRGKSMAGLRRKVRWVRETQCVLYSA